jgi:hypothetical protein
MEQLELKPSDLADILRGPEPSVGSSQHCNNAAIAGFAAAHWLGGCPTGNLVPARITKHYIPRAESFGLQ